MSVMFRKLFALLVGIWALRHIVATFELPAEIRLLWGVVAGLWVVAAVFLIIDRRVGMVSWLVLALTVPEFVAAGFQNREGLSLLAWLALIIALTEERPHERALLVRICATVAYFFAAVSKLNPSWLSGEGVRALPAVHPPLEWMTGPLSVEFVAILTAFAVIAVELLIPAGLWTRTYRSYAAALGVFMHVIFVATLARSLFSFLHLLLLNGGLVLCYVAFWAPIGPESDDNSTPPGGRPGGVVHRGTVSGRNVSAPVKPDLVSGETG